MSVRDRSTVSDIFPQTLRRWRDWRGPIAFPGRKKPASLIYDVDDIPPMAVQIAAAFQHLFVISVGWIYVVLVVSAIGGTSAEAQSLIRMSMIASGIATIAQSKRRIGNGYLCPLTCSLTYLSPAVLAGIAGGYSLMFGMLLTAGTAGMLVSRVVHRLRMLFPPEVTGLMVAMSGLQLVALGCPRFLGYSKESSSADPRAMLIGLTTLFAMIIPTVWTRSKLHLFPMLIGVAAGFAAAGAVGEFHVAHLLAQMPPGFLSFPHRAADGLSVKLALLPPFLIAALTASLKKQAQGQSDRPAGRARGQRNTDAARCGILPNTTQKARDSATEAVGEYTSTHRLHVRSLPRAVVDFLAERGIANGCGTCLLPEGGRARNCFAQSGRRRCVDLFRVLHHFGRPPAPHLSYARCPPHLRRRNRVDLRPQR